MTANLSEADSTPLPLWRLIAGIGVLAILVGLLLIAGFVYLENYRLDRYMRGLAADPASVSLSDSELAARILDEARNLNLPVKASDISMTRSAGKPHIVIGKYTVQTAALHLDLRLPSAASR